MSSVRLRLICALTVATVGSWYFLAECTHAALQSAVKQPSAPATPRDDAAQSTATLELPINFERRLGDLDAMVKRHEIRVLVVPSHSGFFYDKGHPEGIFYEAFEEFQRFVNQKYGSGSLQTNVTFIPVRPEQLERTLLEGVGDIIGYPLIVTPEREKIVSFTAPLYSDVKQVIVSGPKAAPLATLEDLSGREVYVNPLTVYYQNLQLLSESLQKSGKPPILTKSADANLTDEDLLEMVNAGLIPATVTISVRADFWSKVLPHLTLHPGIVLKEEGQLGWATRKDSPQLIELLNEFVKSHQ